MQIDFRVIRFRLSVSMSVCLCQPIDLCLYTPLRRVRAGTYWNKKNCIFDSLSAFIIIIVQYLVVQLQLQALLTHISIVHGVSITIFDLFDEMSL